MSRIPIIEENKECERCHEIRRVILAPDYRFLCMICIIDVTANRLGAEK